MLKVFRDNLKYLSWVLWLVIAVFVLFVFVDFGNIAPGPAPPTEAAATVGGNEISYGELQRAYRQAEERYRQAYGAQFTPELAKQLQLPSQVLEQLVSQQILIEEADRMGLEVSDSELQSQLLELPVFQDASGSFIGGEQYQNVVRSFGYATPEEFEEAFRTDLLLAKLNTVLADNIVVSDTEVETAYRDEAEKAKIKYVRVPLGTFRNDAALAAEEVEAYFQANVGDFRLDERRAVDYLVIDPDVIRQELEIGDDELRAYYQANAADYEVDELVTVRQILLRGGDQRTEEQATQELAAIRARIEGGEDFAQLATELSEDSFTAERGGEMAPFGRGQILPEVEAAAFSAQVGEIVGPIKSSSTYHLLQVLDHTQGGLPPFEQMQEAVSRRVLSERARQAAEVKASELSTRIGREGTASPEQFEQLAEEDAAVSFRTTQPFARADNVPGIGRSTPFSEGAFALEPGAVSEPLRIGSGWAIVRLLDIEAPRLPELGEVETDVRATLRNQRAEEEAVARLEAARQEVAGGSTLEAIAEALEASVEESQEFNQSGVIGGTLGSNPALAEAALALEVDGLGGPLVIGGDVVLYQVSERQQFDATQFEVAKEATRDQIAGEKLNELLASVITERREELEITYDPRMAENLGLAG